MKILNRGHLIELINDWGIESYPAKSKLGTRLLHTIVFDKKKDKFYRVEWGEVADKDNIYHLWYNDVAEEVFYNQSVWVEGWLTKKEIEDIDLKQYKEEEHLNLDNYLLFHVENNLVESEVSSANKREFEKGKSFYGIKKAIEALTKGKSVLFFSQGLSKEMFMEKAGKLLKHNKKDALGSQTLKELIHAHESSRLEIEDNELLSTYDIIEKMIKKSNTDEGLDYVVIEGLKMNEDSDKVSYQKEFDMIQKLLEDVSDKLKCSVLITVKIDK